MPRWPGPEMGHCPSMPDVVRVWYHLLVLGTGLSSAGEVPCGWPGGLPTPALPTGRSCYHPPEVRPILPGFPPLAVRSARKTLHHTDNASQGYHRDVDATHGYYQPQKFSTCAGTS